MRVTPSKLIPEKMNTSNGWRNRFSSFLRTKVSHERKRDSEINPARRTEQYHRAGSGRFNRIDRYRYYRMGRVKILISPSVGTGGVLRKNRYNRILYTLPLGKNTKKYIRGFVTLYNIRTLMRVKSFLILSVLMQELRQFFGEDNRYPEPRLRIRPESRL